MRLWTRLKHFLERVFQPDPRGAFGRLLEPWVWAEKPLRTRRGKRVKIKVPPAQDVLQKILLGEDEEVAKRAALALGITQWKVLRDWYHRFYPLKVFLGYVANYDDFLNQVKEGLALLRRGRLSAWGYPGLVAVGMGLPERKKRTLRTPGRGTFVLVPYGEKLPPGFLLILPEKKKVLAVASDILEKPRRKELEALAAFLYERVCDPRLSSWKAKPSRSRVCLLRKALRVARQGKGLVEALEEVSKD